MRIDRDTRSAIEDLIAEHAWLLDRDDPARLPELYTDDGELLGLGEPLVGGAALQRWATQRAAMTERVSRHVHTNLRLTATEDAGVVIGDLITLLYRHDGEGTGPTWPFLVLDYHDVYHRDGDRWRFASRTVSRVFTDTTRVPA